MKRILTNVDLCGNKIDNSIIESNQIKLDNYISSEVADYTINNSDNLTEAINKLENHANSIDKELVNIYNKTEVDDLIAQSITKTLNTPV